MKSFPTFAAIVALAATPLAAAQSIICDYTELAQAFPDAELDQCQSESGFDLFSSTAPIPATLAKFCESDTCVSLWKAAVELNLPECSINGVDLTGEILEPIETACKRNVNARRLDGDMTKTTTAPSTTTPSSTTVKAPSVASATPSTTTKTPSTASTTPNTTAAAKTPSATSASTTPSTTAKTPSTTPSAAKTPSTTPSATAKTPTATSGASTLTVAVGTVMAAVGVVMF
uniref:Elicitin-like protein n=1 Tax=Globisporangium ultimum (strain ATCC 200006 / CBS 805.95 / DAOM BR144) TaxID=431595 RepID=K3WVC2_GLOUD